MPDWTSYFSGYAAGTSTSDGWINRFIDLDAELQQEFEAYQQERKRKDLIMEQEWQDAKMQVEKERQLIEDKERYPLFFLKEGIV